MVLLLLPSVVWPVMPLMLFCKMDPQLQSPQAERWNNMEFFFYLQLTSKGATQFFNFKDYMQIWISVILYVLMQSKVLHQIFSCIKSQSITTVTVFMAHSFIKSLNIKSNIIEFTFIIIGICGWNTAGLWLVSRQFKKLNVSIFMFELLFLSLKRGMY